jgi:large subunit ribosomal protein L23
VNEKRLYSIILGPHTTEKSVKMSDKNRQVAFRVARDATKPEVAKAIEKLFSVKVDSVGIVNVKGKIKQFKQVAGQRSDWKKAYVHLAEGHDINLANFQD